MTKKHTNEMNINCKCNNFKKLRKKLLQIANEFFDIIKELNLLMKTKKLQLLN